MDGDDVNMHFVGVVYPLVLRYHDIAGGLYSSGKRIEDVRGQRQVKRRDDLSILVRPILWAIRTPNLLSVAG